MLRSVGAHRNERQIDVGGIHAGKFDFRLFRRFLQTLHRHLVFRKIDAVRLLEFVHKIFHNLVIPVVAAKVRIAVRGKHFKHAVRNFKNGNVERTAAEVVNHHLAALVFVKPVRKRRRRRFVDDTKHVQPGNLAGVFRCLTLRIGEVRGAGNYGFRNFLSEVRFRVRL